jgi:hypothetical protein
MRRCGAAGRVNRVNPVNRAALAGVALAGVALGGCLNSDAQLSSTLGDTLMDTRAEPPGENCPEGGILLMLGPDENRDGLLEPDEVTQQEYICNGYNPGVPLAVTTDEPPGDNCAYGGTRLDVGNDVDQDGLLDPEEVSETIYLCDDAPGGGFQVPQRVVTGARRSCAIRAGGEVVCWGNGYLVTSLPEAGPFVDVAIVNSSDICGLRPDGSLACWSDRVTWDWPWVLPTGPFTDWDGHCGLRTDGTVGCIDDFRLDGTFTAVASTSCHIVPYEDTNCPRYACGVRTDGTVACADDGGSPSVALVPPSGTFTQVSVGIPYETSPSIRFGVPFACGVRTDGTLACWGNRTYLDRMPIPTGTFKSVSAGLFHACGIRTDDTVTCWGAVAGMGASALFDLSPPGAFRDVSAGWEASCGIRDDGEVSCWGWCDALGTCDVPAEVYR